MLEPLAPGALLDHVYFEVFESKPGHTASISVTKDLATHPSFPSCAGPLAFIVDLYPGISEEIPGIFFKGDVSTLGFRKKRPANFPCSHVTQQNQGRWE